MPGKFIVFEGLDGAGKATQCELVAKNLQDQGYQVEKFSAPQYGTKSAGPAEGYIKGVYGPMDAVPPFAAALLFAVDHFDMGFKIKQALADNKIVLTDRYVPSNIAYQGARIEIPAEREKFAEWIAQIEYGALQLPRPDCVIFLHIPPQISFLLAKNRAAQNNHGQDQYERNLKFQKNVDMMYVAMAKNDNSIRVINCVSDGNLLSVEQINSLIMSVIYDLLK